MGGRTGVSPNRSETSRRRGGAPEPVEEASGEEIGPHGHRESFRGDGKSHRAASRRGGGGGHDGVPAWHGRDARSTVGMTFSAFEW
jgi:hypothetical protein